MYFYPLLTYRDYHIWFRGPRFGGALDDAARMFCEAFDLQLTPEKFVERLGRMGRGPPGKTTGKTVGNWRFHGKTMGKPRETDDFMGKTMDNW